MRTSLIAMGVAVGLVAGSSWARAQQSVEAPGAPTALPGQGVADAPTGLQGLQGVIQDAVVGSPAQGHPYPTAPVAGSAPIAVDGGSMLPPYSYYVTYPVPARTYVGLGAVDQFPFQGQAYGHPGDRWSWTGMMGNRAAGLDRYYYQLLP